ncbi:protein of unknown function [Streptantibioticus cattleyicolor NRRL 8057 = DSM 46488]|nr:protein of unknown function [Streptantibioticus cattleyicolor NRRL 8057 = DSM 46488]
MRLGPSRSRGPLGQAARCAVGPARRGLLVPTHVLRGQRLPPTRGWIRRCHRLPLCRRGRGAPPTLAGPYCRAQGVPDFGWRTDRPDRRRQLVMRVLLPGFHIKIRTPGPVHFSPITLEWLIPPLHIEAKDLRRLPMNGRGRAARDDRTNPPLTRQPIQ